MTLEEKIREAAFKSAVDLTTGQWAIVRNAVDKIMPIVNEELELYKQAFKLSVESYVGGLDSWEHSQSQYAADQAGLTVVESEMKDFLEAVRKDQSVTKESA